MKLGDSQLLLLGTSLLLTGQSGGGRSWGSSGWVLIQFTALWCSSPVGIEFSLRQILLTLRIKCDKKGGKKWGAIIIVTIWSPKRKSIQP